MKLLNQSLLYLSVPLLAILSIWSAVFYFNMLDEINDSIDDGLKNTKQSIIQHITTDTTLLQQNNFHENNYAIQEITKMQVLSIEDRYIDTTIYLPHEDDPESVRMLSSTFELHGRNYSLQVFSSKVEEDDLMETLFGSVIWLYAIMLTGMLLINKFILQKLWRPFYEILKQLKIFRLENIQELPDIKTNTKEFQALKTAVNDLTQRTLETYIQQKQFTENAAHELQTPLAIAVGKLELLLERESLQEAHATDIEQVLQIVERLIRLNKSLLLLTKIENRQFASTQIISINQTVRQSLIDLDDFISFKNITVSVQESAQIEVNMDPNLASILFSNLIKNAIFHNQPNGTVTIEVHASALKICNTGTTTPLPPDKIFNRFYKHTTAQTSTGLGLAIAKAICHLYGFELSYHHNSVHCFEIQFKNV